jgi:hypothetical protein
MESKKVTLAASRVKAKDKLARYSLNKEIDELRETILPYVSLSLFGPSTFTNIFQIPHLLLPELDFHYLPKFPYEKLNSPFQSWEVRPLQYMTLIADAERGGTVIVKGDWEDEYRGPTSTSADNRSNMSTPIPFNKDGKKASVKYSIKDYKNMKQTGVKPSPKPPAADTERVVEHSRKTSAISTDTPMSRVPSLEGGLAGVKTNGVNSASNLGPVGRTVREEKSVSLNLAVHGILTQLSRSNEPRAVTPEIKGVSRSITNGNIDSAPRAIQSKDTNILVSKNNQQRASHMIKHVLPPRPQSPRRDRQVSETKKRPLDSATNPAEKRTKTEQAGTTISSSNHSTGPRSDSKPSPVKHQKPPTTASQVSNLSKKPDQNTKLVDKPHPKVHTETSYSEKPHDLPPLLSPLPADLEDDPTPNVSSGAAKAGKNNSSKNSSSNTPTKSKRLGQDIVVVRKTMRETTPISNPSKSASSPFVLPRLLSPDLPDIVEDELRRLQQKSMEQKTVALNTVEARHEKARQPDAPGVARKTVKSKVGHPPKKTNVDSSKLQEEGKDATMRKGSLIVTLSFKKKSSRKRVEQYVRLKGTPDTEFKRLEAIRLGTYQTTPVISAQGSDSEEDTPLAVAPKTKPTPPPSKKRPAEPTDARTSEPPAKRKEKERERVETPKPNTTQLKPAFKSPAPTVSNDKGLLATPKRGDAMKSVAMRRVDSSDGHARTPQATAISTPASAEKPRVNGELRGQSAEIERLKAEEMRLTQRAVKIKHKMDDILKIKDPNPKLRENITESQKKLGVTIGLEALTVYMNAFTAQTRHNQLQKRPLSSSSWESLIKLWEFFDVRGRTYPTLHTLIVAIGALIREELRRVGVDSPSYRNGEANTLELLRVNDKERDKLWARYYSLRSVVIELGITDVIGPWTLIPEATNIAIDILTAYSKKEKLGWKREPGN